MRITALKKDTGLSQTYYLETDSTVHGTVVTVYRMKHGRQDCIGQFLNPRQDTADNRPMQELAGYHQDMGEVLEYFSKPQGGTK